jgi:hypothetical protein
MQAEKKRAREGWSIREKSRKREVSVQFQLATRKRAKQARQKEGVLGVKLAQLEAKEQGTVCKQRVSKHRLGTSITCAECEYQLVKEVFCGGEAYVLLTLPHGKDHKNKRGENPCHGEGCAIQSSKATTEMQKVCTAMVRVRVLPTCTRQWSMHEHNNATRRVHVQD